MKVVELFEDVCEECLFEEVMVDEDDNVLSEASIRQFKRYGNTLKRKYRCLSGPKKGKLVADPGGCGTRKDPKNVRKGRKVMRSKKGIIGRKSKISKKKAISRVVSRMNKRLAGK